MSTPTVYFQIHVIIELEDQYGAHNYHPLPVVLKEGKGVSFMMWKTKNIMIFSALIPPVNQGHCHPKIIAALKTSWKTNAHQPRFS